MKVFYTQRLLKSYAAAPVNVRKAFAKKYDESQNLWQGRIDQDWRFYFTIVGDTFHILEMKRYPK